MLHGESAKNKAFQKASHANRPALGCELLVTIDPRVSFVLKNATSAK
jgi:hypothetical protein